MSRRPSSPTPASRVLGIDPGTLRVGFAVVDRHGASQVAVEWGVLRARGELPARLLAIYAGLTELVKRARPSVLALEDVFFGKDVRAMEKIGEGRAIAKLVAAQHGMQVAEYPPATVKRAVAGNGAASKEAVARMVTAAFGLREQPTPADATDALALALCHCTRGGAPQAASLPRSRRRRWTTEDLRHLPG
ncbi:MAG: crossover junction endodeoxyribonuclease RuvC [Planctomycetia bacterium]|nr:crossover junction endodeoxyribonuclease RuvC [Planctomycetia bacterium]